MVVHPSPKHFLQLAKGAEYGGARSPKIHTNVALGRVIISILMKLVVRGLCRLMSCSIRTKCV
jgi:hypothetical protein